MASEKLQEMFDTGIPYRCVECGTIHLISPDLLEDRENPDLLPFMCMECDSEDGLERIKEEK